MSVNEKKEEDSLISMCGNAVNITTVSVTGRRERLTEKQRELLNVVLPPRRYAKIYFIREKGRISPNIISFSCYGQFKIDEKI